MGKSAIGPTRPLAAPPAPFTSDMPENFFDLAKITVPGSRLKQGGGPYGRPKEGNGPRTPVNLGAPSRS